MGNLKNLTIRKLKALNEEVWHGVDYDNPYGIFNGDIAYYSYPIIDLSKPYGEMSADIPDEYEGKKQDFLIMDGYAILNNNN